MDPEKKSLNFIFPTKYVIPKSLKFCHWPRKNPPSFLNSGEFLAVSTTRLGPCGKISHWLHLEQWRAKGNDFPFLGKPIFSGKLTGSFREGIYFH